MSLLLGNFTDECSSCSLIFFVNFGFDLDLCKKVNGLGFLSDGCSDWCVSEFNVNDWMGINSDQLGLS